MDYGPEVYVWMGRNADKALRRDAMVAGRVIWDAQDRPSWGVYNRIASGLETALFRVSSSVAMVAGMPW